MTPPKSTISGLVTDRAAARNSDRPTVVVNAAAAGRITVGNRQTLKGHICPAAHRKHAGAVVPADGYARIATVNRDRHGGHR